MKQGIVILGLLLAGAAQATTWGEFLRGHWQSDCKRSTKGTYTQTGYTFSDFTGPEFALVMQATAEYHDAKCTKLSFYSQNTGRLNLKALVANQTLADAPKTGTKIRWQIYPLIQYPYASYDKKTVEELNRKAYCGKTDWLAGRAKDILQTDCGQDVRDFYATTWFTLEVADPSTLRLADKAGNREEVKRWAFSPVTAPGR